MKTQGSVNRKAEHRSQEIAHRLRRAHQDIQHAVKERLLHRREQDLRRQYVEACLACDDPLQD